MIFALVEQYEKYYNRSISRDEYDKRRYNYPKYYETSVYVKILLHELNDTVA